ncbi:YktB family protein [Bacillus sp. FJAT-45350]|uniref:YktB family protein n=1 Tax=Bacillus sp. FJAT-45350 TaxID=2011014 RepID=UPI000BB96225|nr:DUF1054 domain-containing protein [Bacillus sp. FJAT-45350]
MDFQGFEQKDFDVFTIEGLDPRMDALKERVRPKLEQLGEHLAPTLSTMTGDEMFPHVAKHARRKVNPPNDTWVAFANNKRGYKMLPHFQIGLFESHLFVWFAVIYEAPIKEGFSKQLLAQSNKVKDLIPDDYMWSGDHMKPDATKQSELDLTELESLFERLGNVKKAEILCGIHIDRHDPILSNGQALLKKIEETFKTVMPIYKMAQQSTMVVE